MRVLKNVWRIWLWWLFSLQRFQALYLAQDTEWYAHKGYTVEEVCPVPVDRLCYERQSG